MWRCNEDVFSQLLFLEEPCAQALSGKMLILVWELLSGLAKVLDILLYWVILSLYWLQGSCFCHVSTLFIPLSPCGCLVVVSIRVSAAKSGQVSFWRIDRRNNGAGDIMRQIYLKQVPQDSLLQRIEAVRFDKWFRRSTELNMSWSQRISSLPIFNHFKSLLIRFHLFQILSNSV